MTYNFQKLKKFFYLYILKRKYYRSGKCLKCGACCENIYVNHGKSGFIKSEEEFRILRLFHSFYRNLAVIGSDETGLLFRCMNFDKDTKRCKKHFLRSSICRKYPMEEIFKMGGILHPECGYSFKPVETFDDIMNKLSK